MTTPVSPPPPPRFRIVLADDHKMVVTGLKLLLEPAHDVVAIAHSGDELLRVLPKARADCVLLDLDMPGENGLAMIPRIREQRPTPRILMVTMLVDRMLADACLKAGAGGFVPKDSSGEELLHAIDEVMADRKYISPAVPRTTHHVSLEARHLGLHRLTPRQQQVVLLIGDGKSGVVISEELGLSPSTITFHKNNIMRILGMNAESDLVRYCVLVRAGQKEADTVAPHSSLT